MKLCAMALFCLMIVSSCSINKWMERAYHKNVARGPFDVIIVPGFPYDTSEDARHWMNVRIYWAKALYDRGLARNIIFSGNAVHTPYVEAEIMKMAADSMGIPSEHTFIENKAHHTKQNLSLGCALAHKLGFRKIAIATDGFQYIYTRIYRWRLAPGTCVLPLRLDSVKYYDKALPDINQTAAYVQK